MTPAPQQVSVAVFRFRRIARSPGKGNAAKPIRGISTSGANPADPALPRTTASLTQWTSQKRRSKLACRDSLSSGLLSWDPAGAPPVTLCNRDRSPIGLAETGDMIGPELNSPQHPPSPPPSSRQVVFASAPALANRAHRTTPTDLEGLSNKLQQAFRDEWVSLWGTQDQGRQLRARCSPVCLSPSKLICQMRKHFATPSQTEPSNLECPRIPTCRPIVCVMDIATPMHRFCMVACARPSQIAFAMELRSQGCQGMGFGMAITQFGV